MSIIKFLSYTLLLIGTSFSAASTLINTSSHPLKQTSFIKHSVSAPAPLNTIIRVFQYSATQSSLETVMTTTFSYFQNSSSRKSQHSQTIDTNTGSPLTDTDARQKQTSYAYDAFNRLIQTYFPDGQHDEVSYSLDTRQYTQKTAHANGLQEKVVRDMLGNVLSQSNNANGASPGQWHALVQNTYNDLGQVEIRINANQVPTTFIYDATGRVTEADEGLQDGHPQLYHHASYDDVVGSVTTFTHSHYVLTNFAQNCTPDDCTAPVTKTIDTNNSQINYNATPLEPNLSLTPASSPVRSSRYLDNFGQVVKSITARKHTSATTQALELDYSRNSLGQIVRSTLLPNQSSHAIPADRKTVLQFDYDVLGHPISKQISQAGMAAKRGFWQRFNTSGHLLDEQLLGDGNNNRLIKQYRYDANQNLRSIYDWHRDVMKNKPLTQKPTLRYKAYKNILGQDKPIDIFVSAYQPSNGTLQSAYDIMIDYTADGLIKDTYYQGGIQGRKEIDYTYYGNTRQVKTKTYVGEDNHASRTISYTYHSDGSLATRVDPLNNKTVFHYNNVTGEIPLLDLVTFYDDKQQKIASITYSPDHLLRQQQKIRTQFNAQQQPHVVDSVISSYDAFGSLKDVKHQYNADTNSPYIEHFHYQHDDDNHLSQVQYDNSLMADGSSGYTTNYAYDNANRLVHSDTMQITTSANEQDTTVNNYYYSANGNLLNNNVLSTQTGVRGLQITANTIVSNQYNGLDQVTHLIGEKNSPVYDPNTGDMLLNTRGDKLVYTALHQLHQFTDPQGHQVTYQYYPDGLLASKTAYDKQGTPINSLRFFYIAQQLVSTISDTPHTTQHNSADYLIAGMRNTRITTIAGKRLITYYSSDIHGSITSRTQLDDAGKRHVSYQQYQDYGYRTQANWNGKLSLSYDPMGYSGEYMPQEGNGHLVYLRARLMDTDTHQFTTLDMARGMNNYGYASANPVTFGDPSGNSSTNTVMHRLDDVAAFLGTGEMIASFFSGGLLEEAVFGGLALTSTSFGFMPSFQQGKALSVVNLVSDGLIFGSFLSRGIGMFSAAVDKEVMGMLANGNGRFRFKQMIKGREVYVDMDGTLVHNYYKDLKADKISREAYDKLNESDDVYTVKHGKYRDENNPEGKIKVKINRKLLDALPDNFHIMSTGGWLEQDTKNLIKHASTKGQNIDEFYNKKILAGDGFGKKIRKLRKLGVRAVLIDDKYWVQGSTFPLFGGKYTFLHISESWYKTA